MTNGVVMGFDYGYRRIGVAVGQAITGTATPLASVPARDGKPAWEQIEALIQQWQPDTLVVGLPLRTNGEASETTEAAQRFARRLEGRYKRPVHLMDERFSSREAEKTLSARGKRHQKQDIDPVAAQIILQDWLDLNGETP